MQCLPASGLHDGVYSAGVRADIDAGRRDAVRAELGEIGGRYDWYGVARRMADAGAARPAVRRTLPPAPPATPVRDERRPRRALAPGTPVDWWTVVRHTDDELVLRGQDWFAGDALLGYRVDGDTVLQVGALRTRGVPGFLYWKLLTPVHHLVFRT